MYMKQAFDKVLKNNKVKLHGENAFEILEKALQRAPVIFRTRTPTPIFELLIKNQSYVIRVMRDVLRTESRLKIWRKIMLTHDEKQALLDEAVRSVKFMEEIAVMLTLSTLAEDIRSTFYNLDEGGLQRISENDFICIEKEGLTEEQFKMSPYAKHFVHEPKIRTVASPPRKRARTVTPTSKEQQS